MLTLKCFSGKARASSCHFMHSIKPYMKWCSSLVENSSSKRIDLMSTSALIYRTRSYLMMLRDLLASWAFNSIGITLILYPLQTSIIIREVFPKVFCGKFTLFSFHRNHLLLKYKYSRFMTCCQGILTIKFTLVIFIGVILW